jgi:hypothetical protein
LQAADQKFTQLLNDQQAQQQAYEEKESTF